jgi:hypothetical protein
MTCSLASLDKSFRVLLMMSPSRDADKLDQWSGGSYVRLIAGAGRARIIASKGGTSALIPRFDPMRGFWHGGSFKPSPHNGACNAVRHER